MNPSIIDFTQNTLLAKLFHKLGFGQLTLYKLKAKIKGYDLNDFLILNEFNLDPKVLNSLRQYFDCEYYLKNNDDVNRSEIDPLFHYLKFGWHENRDPNNWFSTKYYIDKYDDVKQSAINPLLHYVLFGKSESRVTNEIDDITTELENIELTKKEKSILQNISIINKSGLFSRDYYEERYPEVNKEGFDPLRHYCEYGWNERKQTSPEFNIELYLKSYPFIEPLGINPLIHKISLGRVKANEKIFCSVVIPTYNRSELLPELLNSWKSVLRKSEFSFELIICDDGSEDNTVEIIKKETELPITLLELNHGGPGSARNAGVNIAKGEIILFVGDDIYPHEDLINQHCACHVTGDNNIAVLGLVDWPNNIMQNYLMHHITNIGCEQFGYGVFEPYDFYDFKHFYTCNISIHRNRLNEQPVVFNDLFVKANYEDTELGFRLEKEGLKIVFNPKAFGFHYHEYTYNKFLARQVTAGEMSLVFRELCGPEVENLVAIDKIKNKYTETLLRYKSFSPNKLNEYIDEINYLLSCFDDISRNEIDFNISSLLSEVFSKIFQVYKDKGVLGKVFNLIDLSFEKYFFANLASDSFTYTILRLYHFLEETGFNNTRFKNLNIGNLETALYSFAQLNKVSTRICIVIRNESLSDYIEKYSPVSESVLFLLDIESNDESGNSDNWYYFPNDFSSSISVSKLKQVLLCASKHNTNVSQILVADSLKDPDDPSILSEIKHIFYHNTNSFHTNSNNSINASKLIRLLPEEGPIGDRTNHISILSGNTSQGYYTNKNTSGVTHSYLTNRLSYKVHIPNDKPIVFIFPTFLATGGVERLTASIIKQLENNYYFVVINFERLDFNKGSLHDKFLPICLSVYDLCELVPEDYYIEALNDLKRMYKPSLLWITNGSVWLSNNFKNIRNLFHNIPIIDQEVYDVSKGWINSYSNNGLLSFDRFIAINSKIKDRFLNDFKINEDQVDLIYHAVDSDRIVDPDNLNKNDLLKKYNIDPNLRVYATIGRLTAQKRPMLFLKMVETLQNKSFEEAVFVMIGEGEMVNEIDNYIEQKSLRVKRLGFIDNIGEILSLLSGVIFTSEYEGLPIAALEALCYNIPVFSTDVGDLGLVLEKYKAGQTVNVEANHADLAKSFMDFHKNINEEYFTKFDFAKLIRADFSDNRIASLYEKSWKKGMKKHITH